MSELPEKTRPLEDDERDWLVSKFAEFYEFAGDAGVNMEEQEAAHDRGEEALDTPEICDAIIAWWHAIPQKKRPDANDVVNAVGVAMGDFMRHVLNVEWCIVEGQGGPDFALVNEDDGQHLFFPLHSVAKRFEDADDGFVVEFLEQLFDSDAMKDLFRPEDSTPEPLFDDEEQGS